MRKDKSLRKEDGTRERKKLVPEAKFFVNESH